MRFEKTLFHALETDSNTQSAIDILTKFDGMDDDTELYNVSTYLDVACRFRELRDYLGAYAYMIAYDSELSDTENDVFRNALSKLEEIAKDFSKLYER